MAGPRPVAGGRALLFERLVDLEPGLREARPFILHDRAGVKASVRVELERLLSTRLSQPPSELAQRQRTTMDYGIPDGANVSPADPDGRTLLAAQIAAAIKAFEPRLADPAVRLAQAAGRGDRLIAEIDATLAIEGLLEPISFTIPLGNDHER
jgi:type VI secretion system lysozyme-related protein